MKVQQISVFLENKSGRLAELTEVLGQAGINIRALSIADTSDFGILRLIVNKPEEAFRILKDDGFSVSITDVIAVEVQDDPGGLARVMGILNSAGINIEYLYAFLEKSSNDALVVFRVEQVDEAVELLAKHNVNVVKGSEVYKL
ncbi:ACT domain-containing protein [Phosphitispora fastidiosa]|uniref:ACT domain-containing protein n=1 Tax=Phosphitispora fastidiosa TaxID=2837202 RepID=UPI001E58F587|nr:ACT domain-containing protein [Phosphitispora fastidiosa]MBU7008445.1 hypothetical protein [Phosphitispora fastidiosa]